MNGINGRLTEFLAEQGAALLQQIPGIRNGDGDAIHDARVATRRMRAALSLLVQHEHPAWQAIDQQMRSLTRALGAARDLDVIAELIARKHRNGTSSDDAFDTFRRTVLAERDNARRALVKALEAVPLHAIVPTDHRHATRWWPARANLAHSLVAQLHQESTAVLDAIEHASGIYFPRRSHQVRVHTKRLRYLVELAMHARQWRSNREPRLLARVQSVLGDLHDREVLLQRLAQIADGDSPTAGAIRARTTAERDDLFDDYLRLRDRLRRVSEAIHAATTPTRPRWTLIATSVAVPSAFLAGLIAAKRSSRRPQADTATAAEGPPHRTHLIHG